MLRPDLYLQQLFVLSFFCVWTWFAMLQLHSLAFTASYWHIAVLTGCRPAVRQFVDHALALALVQLADLTAEARHGVHVR